jgi:hypothetical protein
MHMRSKVSLFLVILPVIATSACGQLGPIAQLIQPPRFEQGAQPAELRFITPSITHPAGGAGVTIWLKVTNPNPFGFTLSTLDATLTLEGSHAATGSFPLGLPLQARQETTVPIDLSISFADLPGLGAVVQRAATGQPVNFQLDGTIGVEAGRFGQPTFGPMRLVTGELRTR